MQRITFLHRPLSNLVAKMVFSTKVKVKQGIVAGGEGVLPNGNSYLYFKGIPYGVPPLGALRFKAPVPLEKFSASEIDCTKEGAVSFQKDGFTGKVIGSEDCLFLNVFTPKVKSTELLPVMVYVHGGGFSFGSGNSDWYNPLYLMQEDVVVVTINYRLGCLGFLSLPEGGIPGNAGLKDQRLALQWVQENILQFNGDPNNVTLFGESAGGCSVHLHVLSENSRKFFHKAIIQSGLGNMLWAIDDNPTPKAMNIAKILGCTSTDTVEVVKFLQNFPDLNQIMQPYIPPPTMDDLFYGRPIPIKPVIELDSLEAVITRPPIEAMSDLDSIDIPLMMGYNSAEGIVIMPRAIEMLEEFDGDMSGFVPLDFNLQPDDPKRLEVANAVKQFYFQGKKLDRETLFNFCQLLGDYFFSMPANTAAEIHARTQQKSQLFFYRFDYDGALNLYKKISQFKSLPGASHADDLFYIFQAAIAPEPWEENAKKMVTTMTKMWTNFAKYSNPTPPGNAAFADCTWDPIRKVADKEPVDLNAFIIDLPLKMIENPDKDRVLFWKTLRKTYSKEVVSPKL